MIDLTVKVRGLANFIGWLKEQQVMTPRLLTKALNETAEGAMHQATVDLSASTGLPEAVVARTIRLSRATAGNMRASIKLDADALERERAAGTFLGRQFDKGGDRDRDFREGELFSVETAGDDKVCPICARIALEGPYNDQEITRLKAMHPHFLNERLRCRCATTPFEFKQRLEVGRPQGHREEDRRGEGTEERTARYTTKQLADILQKELAISFKLVK